jgi:hypothetical protein
MLSLLARKEVRSCQRFADFSESSSGCFLDEHNPPHIHAEYQGHKAVFDLLGNIDRGDLESRTATRLVREWIDLHVDELRSDWELALAGKEIKKIAPLE